MPNDRPKLQIFPQKGIRVEVDSSFIFINIIINIMIITIITIVKMMIIITTITIVNVMMIITTTRDQSRPGNMSSYLTSSLKPAGLTAAR